VNEALPLPVKLEQEALHGVAGEYATAVQTYTEACVPAVLGAVLVAFGSAVGRNPFVRVGGTTHYVNENVLLVGPTAVGRKGDAMQLGIRPIEFANMAWIDCHLGGFGSGEAVVDAVRDPTTKLEGDEEVVIDQGASDKRLLVFEEELSHVIAVAGRDGSTLSSLLRKAWDGRRLENRTKGRRLIATGAHVSTLAGITPEELVRKMPDTEYANGFMNRFLVVAVRRSRVMPNPPAIPQTFDVAWGDSFRTALEFTRKQGAGVMERDADAAELWDAAYRSELSIERPGLAGAVCARAEAHTLRLSMLYALLDCSQTIKAEHIQAALAFWRYCGQSAKLIFGDRIGDPIADTIHEEARLRGELTRTEIRDLFSRHRSGAEIDRALDDLVRLGRLRVETRPTEGRSITVYSPCDKSDQSDKRGPRSHTSLMSEPNEDEDDELF
jgi:Protein of unknown function (DUF3987)